MNEGDSNETYGARELLRAYLDHQETHKEDRKLARYHRQLYEALRDCSGVNLERWKRQREFRYDIHVQMFQNAVQHYLMAGRSPLQVPGLVEGLPCRADYPLADRIHAPQRLLRGALLDLMLHCLDFLEPDKVVAVGAADLRARGIDPIAKPEPNWDYWRSL